MSEEEEFEFRARAEAEASAPSAIASNATGIPKTQPQTTYNSLGQEAARQGGLTLRNAANIIGSPLTMGGNLIGKVLNAGNSMLGGDPNYFKPSTETFNKSLDALGLPTPERPTEKFTQNMAESAPALAIPGGMQAQVAGNALVGAIQAPQGQEVVGAAGGGFGGALGHALPSAIAKGLPGVSQAARQLMDTTNIQPTVGMAIPRLRALEEFSTGVPVLGEATTVARNRAINEFSSEAISKAVPGLKAESLKGSPFEQIDAANDHVSSIFYDTLPKVMPEVSGNPFAGVAGGSTLGPSAMKFAEGYKRAKGNSYLTDAQQDILDRVYQARGPNISKYTGEQLKTLDAELGEQIRKYQRGAGTSDLGDALAEMQLGLREGIELRLPPEAQGKLAEANRSYRELIALNDAASKTPEMTITPQRLSKALASRDKRPITRLSGPMAEYARSAETVIPNSAGVRGMSTAGVGGALAGTGLAALTGKLPLLLGLTGGGIAGSTRGAQAALTGNLALQRALRARIANNPSIAPAIGGSLFRPDEE